MDKTMKQVDLAAILSVLLETSFPYSNLGVPHPIFVQTDDLIKVNNLYLKNLEQI